VIELLGIGIPRPDGSWRLRRVCAHLPSRTATAVLGPSADERAALLDAVTARVIPTEGRVWVSGTPLMPETARRVRSRVAEVALDGSVAVTRSVLWNALAPERRRLRVFPKMARRAVPARARVALERVHLGARADELVSGLDGAGRVRLAVACALLRAPDHLVVREIDTALDATAVERLLGLLRVLARRDGVSVLVSAVNPAAVDGRVDRALVIARGALILDCGRGALTAHSTSPIPVAQACPLARRMLPRNTRGVERAHRPQPPDIQRLCTDTPHLRFRSDPATTYCI
jgi:ABC-type glutathione transport system ATPase component